ncbi:MAG: isoprenylcysteine carboxylmethyltransferase family protein [Anaerolineales bacterium]|nr:isoprenylcysteine carboxylmethyltransferase family protein [Anaerolineales bacterium]
MKSTNRKIWARGFLRILIVLGVMAAILFGSAGRLDWSAAWLLALLYIAFLLVVMGWGLRSAPELLQERSRVAENVKPWDKWINAIYALLLLALLVVAGLDAGRCHWSSMPLPLQAIGFVGFAMASWVIWRTMVENAYASRWARIQEERGQRVVSSGPYRYVRHPMYAAVILLVLCSALALGSYWALIPGGLTAILFVIRTALEDRMLHEELDGYREYASRVRYRLMPGVW